MEASFTFKESVKAALHSQRFERAGAATKKEHAQLIKFSDQSNRKRPIFGRFGSRNKFNSHRGRLRALLYSFIYLFYLVIYFKIIYPGYNSVYILFYNWPCKNYLQNKELYITKFTIKIKNNVYDYFSLSLDLKALIEGAIFVSKSRLFQRLAPRYA